MSVPGPEYKGKQIGCSNTKGKSGDRDGGEKRM